MNKTALRCSEIALALGRKLDRNAQKLRLQGSWCEDIAYVVQTRAETCRWVAQAIRKEFKNGKQTKRSKAD